MASSCHLSHCSCIATSPLGAQNSPDHCPEECSWSRTNMQSVYCSSQPLRCEARAETQLSEGSRFSGLNNDFSRGFPRPPPAWTLSRRTTSSLASPLVPRATSPEEAETSGGGPAELPSVSVVIPVFNEVHNIPILVERVGEALSGAGWPHEIIVVDDGSTDGTVGVLRCIAAEKPEVRVLVLNRNFGQSAAMMAGFDYSAGDLVVTIDGDLQNDASDIPRLLKCMVFGAPEQTKGSSRVNGGPQTLVLFEQSRALAPRPASALVRRDGPGFDMVCGWRRNRKDNFFSRNLPSALANLLIARLTGVKLHDYGCSLKAYRGDLARSLKLYGELHRFVPALAAMEGAAVYEMPVKHHARRAGKSKYSILRTPRVLLDLALVLFLKAFRDRPMQFFGFLALFPFVVSCTFLGMFCRTALQTGPSYGWGVAMTAAMPHLVATLEFFMGAVLLVCLGLVADMCMRTYFESQKGSVYRVREVAAQEAL